MKNRGAHRGSQLDPAWTFSPALDPGWKASPCSQTACSSLGVLLPPLVISTLLKGVLTWRPYSCPTPTLPASLPELQEKTAGQLKFVLYFLALLSTLNIHRIVKEKKRWGGIISNKILCILGLGILVTWETQTSITLDFRDLIKAVSLCETKHWLLLMSIQWSQKVNPLIPKSQFLLLENKEIETHDFQGYFQS